MIHLPIIGTAETFRWGVWLLLGRENLKKLREMDDDPKRVELPAMFSWLSSKLAGYPDTLNLKMQVHIQQPHDRPKFELDDCDHPLAQEFHHGIMPKRVKEITMDRFGGNNELGLDLGRIPDPSKVPAAVMLSEAGTDATVESPQGCTSDGSRKSFAIGMDREGYPIA